MDKSSSRSRSSTDEPVPDTSRTVDESNRLFASISQQMLASITEAQKAQTQQSANVPSSGPTDNATPTSQLMSPLSRTLSTGAGALPQRPTSGHSRLHRTDASGRTVTDSKLEDGFGSLRRLGSAVAVEVGGVDLPGSQHSDVEDAGFASKQHTQDSQHETQHKPLKTKKSVGFSARNMPLSAVNVLDFGWDVEEADLNSLLKVDEQMLLKLQAKAVSKQVRMGTDNRPEIAHLVDDDDTVPDYSHTLEEQIAAEEVVIGWVDEEQVIQRERELEEQRRRHQEEEERRAREKEERLRKREEEARARIVKEKAELAERIQKRQAETQEAAEAREAAIHRTFRRAHVELKSALAKQHAMVSDRYGRLVPGRAGARMLRVEWHKLPQPVEIRISRMRGVKDKLPSGRYVLLATLYDRLGGTPLRWTKAGLHGGGDSSRPAATTPVRHRGRYYDTEISFNQCVYTVAPSQVDLRPSHVIILELFMLGDRSNPIDRVVAWTALPACDRDFQVVWGKFKLPMLRGEVDLAVDKYRGVESNINKDLDTWLSNIYVEVVHLPRETIQDGVLQREFDVELAYTSELLRIRGEYRAPKRWGRGLHHQAAGKNSSPTHRQQFGLRNRRGSSEGLLAAEQRGQLYSLDEGSENEEEEEEDSESTNEGDAFGVGYGWDDEDDNDGNDVGVLRRADHMLQDAEWNDDLNLEAEDLFAGGPPIVTDRVTREDVMAVGPVGQHAVNVPVRKNRNQGPHAASQAVSSSPVAARGVLTSSLAGASRVGGLGGSARNVLSPTAASFGGVGLQDQTAAVGVEAAPRPGAAFAVEAARSKNVLTRAAAALRGRAGNRGVGTAVKASAAGASNSLAFPASKAAGEAGASDMNGLASFTYAINKQEGKGLRGARVRESVRKFRFLQYELIADLSPGSWKTFDFWIQFVLLIIALWLRIYIHYLGQWLYLRSLRIPVYEFAPLVYACTLKYVPDVLPNEIEIGVVVLGPISVIIVFGLFMAFSWLCQRLLGSFPEIPSRFFAFFGFAAVLDPGFIAIIDAAAGRYDCATRFPACALNFASPQCLCSEGDAWKLYNRFLREEGSGVIGIILTVFMYLVLMILAMFFLYMYLLHLHLNGRMIDLFRRLHAEEHKFLVPHDFEVSPQELQVIVNNAQRWRGARGATRKVAVCDYVLTDPLDPAFKEKTTHLIIYNASLDGSRDLYRHFLRLPDGTILEVFGSMEKQLGVASGLGTSALQKLLMTHGKDGNADSGQAVNAFFDEL